MSQHPYQAGLHIALHSDATRDLLIVVCPSQTSLNVAFHLQATCDGLIVIESTEAT